jgi:hypothetical protein
MGRRHKKKKKKKKNYNNCSGCSSRGSCRMMNWCYDQLQWCGSTPQEGELQQLQQLQQQKQQQDYEPVL